MPLKEYVRQKWQYATGGIYIPQELLNHHGDLLIHISDTPLMSYDAIKKMLQRLKPKWIIHTGDLVDNVKLELSFSKIDNYRRHLNQLVKMLETTDSEVYIAIGNHDHYDSLMALKPPFKVCKKSDLVSIGALRIAYSHYIENLKMMDADIYLFGHNKYQKTEVATNGHLYLNGLEQIAVIDVTNHQYYFLKYPIGTDDSRLLRMRIGI